MPKITKVYSMPPNPPRFPESSVLVYIDGVKCRAVRERTWRAMGLKVGDEITCQELNERENFHWKRVYGASSWEKEKVRLQAVQKLLESVSSDIEIRITGFGAGNTDFIAAHPKESGRPDIEVCSRKNGQIVMFVEVTGTERMRGSSYWVRPDKLSYAKNHPEADVWIILHFNLPEDKFVFVKPNPTTEYVVSNIEIRGSLEYYVEFNDSDSDVYTFDAFKRHVSGKIR